MKKIILCIFVGILMFLVGVYFLYRDTYLFEKGKIFAENKEYEQALEYFGKIKNQVISHHNRGNIFVLSAEERTQIERIDKYEQALHSYSGALNIEENEATRYNYEYVKNLLVSIKKQQQNNQDTKQESSEDSSSQENEVNNEDTTSQKNDVQDTDKLRPQETDEKNIPQPAQNTLSQQRGEQYQLEEEDVIKKLSPEELEHIEQHIRNLEQEQQENQEFYGKQVDTTSSDIFDQFFGTKSFFQKEFGSTKKDW